MIKKRGGENWKSKFTDMENPSIVKLAKILRSDKHLLYKVEERFSKLTGKKGVLDKVAAENEEKIKEKLLTLGVPKEARAKEVYDALISKIEADDNRISEMLKRPVCSTKGGCQDVL